MPEKRTIKRAQAKKRAGRSPSTQAGEFVREEIEDIRKGKHGARSAKQAIAIGLSKARRAGVKLPPRPNGKKHALTSDSINGRKKPSRRRSQAILNVLKKEPRSSVSHESLSKQAKAAAKKRGPQARQQAAIKAVKTKGPRALKAAAQKAARTRAQHASH